MAAAFSIICNFTLHYHTAIFFNINFPPSNRISNRKSCFFKFSRICVVSSHTNPKILKPNRRSRYGQPLSTYDSGSDDDDDDSFEDEDDISTSDVSFKLPRNLFNTLSRFLAWGSSIYGY